MPITRLERGAANSWADAGRSIAGGLGALLSGEAVRQKSQLETEKLVADTYFRNMAGNKYGAEAGKIGEETEGLRFTNNLRQNVDAELAGNPDMDPYQRALRVAFKYAGPQHMQNWSAAAVNEKKIADINAVQANPELAQATGLAYAAADGKPMFTAVGDTGVSLNQFTGQQRDANPALVKLFGERRQSETIVNRAQASNASASAANARANAEMTAAKLKHFLETGRMPSASERSSGGLNIGQIRDDIRADYNAMYPIDSLRGRPKDAPSYEEFTRQWLQQYNVPEAEFYGSAGGAAPVQGRAPVSGAPGRGAAPAAAPKVGDVENGFRFKGGDPGSPGSWEKVGQNPAAAPATSRTPAPLDGAMMDSAVTNALNAIKKGAPPESVRRRFAENGITDAMLLDQARAAIAQGKDRAAVTQRLRALGVDPKGL